MVSCHLCVQTLCASALTEFLGGPRRFYLAPESDVQLRDVVKKYFRLPMVPGEAGADERLDAGVSDHDKDERFGLWNC